ncbi:10877_t:CDS:1, partial [Ambispora gerdemannii]
SNQRHLAVGTNTTSIIKMRPFRRIVSFLVELTGQRVELSIYQNYQRTSVFIVDRLQRNGPVKCWSGE